MLRKRIFVGGAVAAFSVAAMATSAGAQPITQSGLVNVAADNTTVQIPISAAANVCGVAVNVLATATNLSDVDCTATGVAVADNEPSGPGGPVTQNGLVNVALTDTTVQVTVNVAANVCGVAVGVLAQATNLSGVDCTADGVSLAEA